MPRLYIEENDKVKFDRFVFKLSVRLDLPLNKMSQPKVMELLMKHDDAVLDVIVTAEAVTNNIESPERVKA